MSNLDIKIDQFGVKLATLRKKNNLTLRQLGKILSVHHTHISQLEKKRKLPNVIMVLKISNFFNVTVDQLVRDELKIE